MKEQIKTMFWEWFSDEPMSNASINLTVILILTELFIFQAFLV